MADKKTRAELIASLVTDKHSGFQDGDEAILEAASDARLEEFRSAADARKAEASAHTKLETEHRNVSARLKVAEERAKDAEQLLTEEEFLARAPEKFKTLIESHAAIEAQERASMVAQLKDLGANTEEELKKMSLPDLRTLAKYARVDVPDFSGRGMPRAERQNETVTYAPPDPYKVGLERLRQQAH